MNIIPDPELSAEEHARLVPRGSRLVCYRGSHTHGTYIPREDATGHDDVDVMSVYWTRASRSTSAPRARSGRAPT